MRVSYLIWSNYHALSLGLRGPYLSSLWVILIAKFAVARNAILRQNRMLLWPIKGPKPRDTTVEPGGLKWPEAETLNEKDIIENDWFDDKIIFFGGGEGVKIHS